MIFENFKLFRDIAQTKSISRGATLNEISQSAASQYMQEVERRLGVSLLDRTTRPLALTPAGKLFFDLCRDVLRREEQFQLQLDNLKGSVEGAVRVASIYSIGLSEMSRLQDEFAARFPHTELHVDYLRPDKVYEAVLADQADLGLVSYPVGTKDLAVIPWREEEMAVAAPPSHPLAKKTVLLPADLNGQEFVGFDEELMIRRELDHFFREQGIEIQLADAVRQYSDDQGSRGAGLGHQHSAGAHHAGGDRAGPAGFDSAACAGAGAPSRHRASQAQTFQPRRRIVSGTAVGTARASGDVGMGGAGQPDGAAVLRDWTSAADAWRKWRREFAMQSRTATEPRSSSPACEF